MFLIISRQIVKMFLLMMVGFACHRAGIVSHEGNKMLSDLLLMVINPMVILDAFQMERTPQLMRGIVVCLLLALLTHLVGILLAHFLISPRSGPDYCVERFSVVYSNCGFMGIPLVSSILGSQGVIFLTAYLIVFNLLVWTHGLILMTGSSSAKVLKKGLLSPVVICIFIGFFLFLADLRLPEVIGDTVSYLAVMNTAVGMLVAGIALSESDLLSALSRKRLYLVCFLRLLAVPLILLAIFPHLPAGYDVLFTILIAAACPSATTCTMFALRFDKNYSYASELFALSTVLSLLTIPAVVFLGERLL